MGPQIEEVVAMERKPGRYLHKDLVEYDSPEQQSSTRCTSLFVLYSYILCCTKEGSVMTLLLVIVVRSGIITKSHREVLSQCKRVKVVNNPWFGYVRLENKPSKQS
jgi:hypothetical protein